MRKLMVAGVVLACIFSAGHADAQMGGRLALEPFVGYGFFGKLPESSIELESDLLYGGRASFQMSPQWGLFGDFRHSTPEVTRRIGGVEVSEGDLTVNQWSAGVEFAYVPRGGAEGMLPILLEAGLGQTRYGGQNNDLAVNLGIASSIRMTQNFVLRYGANDYISNYRKDRGIVNQISVRVGGEFQF